MSLNDLVNKASENEVKTQNTGSNVTYVILCKSETSGVLDPKDDRYIEGLSTKEYYVQSTKDNLGKTVDVVPLQFINLYNEMSSEDRQSSKFLGVWNKADGDSLPKSPTNSFNRITPSGTYLIPGAWVLVKVLGKDYKNAVIPFSSAGMKVFRTWLEMANEQTAYTEMIYTLGSKREESKGGIAYIEVDIQGKRPLYELKDGKYVSEDEALAEEVLQMSIEISENLKKGPLVPHKELGYSANSAQRIEATMEDAEMDETPAF